MKARMPKGYGRPDPQAMMRQVQKMQDFSSFVVPMMLKPISEF